MYPTAGTIGMAEMIRTFVSLHKAGGLDKKLADSTAAFIDRLTFTTRIYGTADPKIELAPATRSLHLASGNNHHMAERQDLHELTLAIAFPKVPAPAASQGEKLTGGVPQTTAEDDALRAIATEELRERTIEFFDNQERILELLE